MKSILIQSIITISLFFCSIPVTYACNPLVIEIRNEDGESFSTMYLKTEVQNYITVQVTSTENVVKDDGDGWHWNEPEGLDITVYSQTSTQLILVVGSDSINSYNLTITAEPEMGGDNATDYCTIRTADISLNCPDLIAYAEGMNINYKLNPPVSIPIGIICIMNSSGNCLFMGGFYQYGPYPIDEDFPWDGKGDTSPYNGLYLPGGDYKVIYKFPYALGFEIEKEFRIVEVDSLSDVDFETGRQYIPLSNEDFYMYADDFYHPIYDQELWLWADSDPHDIYGGTCFPSGSPVWSCTMTPTDPPISSQNGNYSILINNFLGNQTGNFTVTAKASVNDPVGASIDLTSFSAVVAPDNEYIGYETGTDITYNISPGTGWSYYSAEICIINESCDYVYKCEVPGFTGELGWDGMGNWDYEQGQYTEPFYLDPGIYCIGIEIVPFYGSEKYLYYTSSYSPNLTVVKIESVLVDTANDPHTHKIPSVLPVEQNPKDHFVTVKSDSEDIILIASITPNTEEIRNQITWWNMQQDNNNKLKAKFTKQIPGSFTARIKIGGVVVKEFKNWVIWAELTPKTEDTSEGPWLVPQSLGVSKGTNVGVTFNANIEWKAEISPSALFSSIADRPAIELQDREDAPGSEVEEQLNYGILVAGFKGWDMSRIKRDRFLYGNTTKNPPEPLAMTTVNDPVDFMTPTNYPSVYDSLIDPVGNDDTSVGNTEINDPYDDSSGIMWSLDSPGIERAGDKDYFNNTPGEEGDTIRARQRFGEFVRVQLGDTWYRCSDYEFWRFDYGIKLKYVLGIYVWDWEDPVNPCDFDFDEEPEDSIDFEIEE